MRTNSPQPARPGSPFVGAPDRRPSTPRSNPAAPVLDRIVAVGRDEDEACEKSTPGCAIDHSAERDRASAAGLERAELRRSEGSCETW